VEHVVHVGKGEIHIRSSSEDLNDRGHLVHIGVNGRITLNLWPWKWTFK